MFDVKIVYQIAWGLTPAQESSFFFLKGASNVMAAYLVCPNCGGRIFYIERSDGTLVFFKATPGERVIPTGDVHLGYSEAVESEIFCTGCGWRGTIGELKTKEFLEDEV